MLSVGVGVESCQLVMFMCPKICGISVLFKSKITSCWCSSIQNEMQGKLCLVTGRLRDNNIVKYSCRQSLNRTFVVLCSFAAKKWRNISALVSMSARWSVKNCIASCLYSLYSSSSWSRSHGHAKVHVLSSKNKAWSFTLQTHTHTHLPTLLQMQH